MPATKIDRINFTISGDIGTATVNQNEIVLDEGDYEDITLTIPRTALSAAGTYNVNVIATSANNPLLSTTVVATTIVTDDTPTPTDPVITFKTTDVTIVPEGTLTHPDLSTHEVTRPDWSTHEVVLSEFMYETGAGEAVLPQWIEVYNNSNSEVNLRGWKVHWKSLQPTPLDTIATFDEDFRIPAQQARLIVTVLGRRSGGSNLSDDAIFQLPILHTEELEQEIIVSLFQDIIGGGFSLKLLNPEDVLIDQFSTLNGDKKAWELPECLIDGVRSSLMRRFDEGVPRSGIKQRGWIRAYNAKRLVSGIYYGNPFDLGTPGYRRGKPLPVQLSQFSAKFVKGEVVINWTTESELDNAGFNIYRSTSQTKNFQHINTKLIQGAGTTGERNTYQFIDRTAKPNVAYFYRLEDIDLSGTPGILTTYRLRGVITPTGKRITTWATLKNDR